MNLDPLPPITLEQLDAVLRFLPVFEQPGYSYGEWVGLSDAHRRPYYDSSPEVLAFLQALTREGIVAPFDWMAWSQEADRLYRDPAALATADLDTLRRLLTSHVRADRYGEGLLADMLEEGHITAILRRLAELRAEMASSPDHEHATNA